MDLENSLQLSLGSVAATTALADAAASLLVAGDTVLLAGDLGTGKTHFARQVIRARLSGPNQDQDIPSPTYTLVQTYPADNCDIWHADLYRLETPDEVIDLGLPEAFETAICLIEWPDRLGPYRPADALEIRLSHTASDTARRAEISWADPKWCKLTDALGQFDV